MSSFGSDVRDALRALRRQPAFSLVVALTLALGLGVNATVLGMADALLLRPFPFHDYQRLVVLWDVVRGSSEREPTAPATYLDWKAGARSLERIAAWEGWPVTITGREDSERVQAIHVTPGFFETLGIVPAYGRTFAADEDRPGNHQRVIIGDGLWRRRFAADPAIVGAHILLDGAPYTVVGIAPAGFEFPAGSELWAPMVLASDRTDDREHRTITVLGKIAAGTSLSDVQAEMDLLAARIAQQHPATNRDRGVLVRTISTAFREDTAFSFVGVFQVAGSLVLLIACANLAGLLLARALDRQRELAVRAALGASRLRIVRQLMVETVLLALISSVLALLLARIGLDLLRTSMSAETARHIEGWNTLRLDSRLMFAVPALAVIAGLLAGLIPAISGTRGALTDVLRDSDRSAVGGRFGQRARQALVVTEIAVALSVLIAAGLTVAAGTRLANQPGGFEPAHVLRLELPLPESRYQEASARRDLATTLVERIEAIAAVERAAVANVLPASGWSPAARVIVEDQPVVEAAQRPQIGYRAVSSGYFETLRIPIVRGRAFTSADREETQAVAMVSAATAERFWPGADPIGRRLRLDSAFAEATADKQADAGWLTVVGVVGNVTMYNWWDGIDYQAVYLPLRQAVPGGLVHLAARTRGEAMGAATAVRETLRAIDPLLPSAGVRTMEQAIGESSMGLTYMATLMGICGALGAFLAIVGIYSVMAYSVSQRTREFGVRMALGATHGDVVRLTLKGAGMLTAAGVTIGVGLAWAFGRLMSSAMFGLIPIDVPTFLVVSAALGLISLMAAYLPARRALRLDPAAILRG